MAPPLRLPPHSYVNLLRHTSGAGGSITLQMDNTVEVRVGMHSPGDAIAIDLGTLSDAETFLKCVPPSSVGCVLVASHRHMLTNLLLLLLLLLRYHTVSDEDNDYNFVHLALPGGGGSRADMFWQLDTLRKWRREMVRWPHCVTSLTMRERGPNSLPLPTHAPRACHHASQTCGASLSHCTCLEMTRRNRSFCREPTLALQACHCPRTKQPQRSSS